MWTCIPNNEIDSFFKEYDSLQDIAHDIFLYSANGLVFVPRLFYKNYPKHTKVLEYSENNFQKVKFKFTKELRENQIPIVETLLKMFYKNKQINGIIKLPPGIGKTVMAIYLASKLELKTLIIVDNDNLLKQWIKAFIEFTDLQPKDIGIIKQKFMITTTPVSISLVQTLVSQIKRNMKKIFKTIDSAGYGLIIYDEVHSTSSAPKFAKASLLFRTKNILGLSATPFQTGAAEILMKNTIGDIIYETKSYELKPTYIINYYNSNLSNIYSTKLLKINDYIKKKAFYNSILVKSETYFKVIIDLVKKRLNEGHVILILCLTKEQVRQISNKLTEEGIENKKFYGDEKKDFDKSSTKVLIVTYAYAGKGFDFEQLSCLILATNLSGKKSLIQVIGRILRKHSSKLPPIVDDLIDLDFPTFLLPEVRFKKSIIVSEFKCNIIENMIETKQEKEHASGKLLR